VRIAILASGGGSNMAALADHFPVALVVTNEPGAGVGDRAAARGIPTATIDHRPFARDRAAHEAAIHRALLEHGIELVCLAGYMRLLTPFLVQAWTGRMINIHPSLLPAFPGLHTHARAIAAGVKLHGCTVHRVTEMMDEGPILGQAAVPVLPDDTPETLAARVLRQEHRLYPAVLRQLLLQGVWAAPDAALLNPLPAETRGA